MLVWWVSILTELRPKVTRSVSRFPDFVIYSDAATSSNRIAALLFTGGQKGDPIVLLEACSGVPKAWNEAFHKTNLIYGLELLALLGFIYMNRALLANCTVNIYIDNNNALASVIRGDSNTTIIADMVAVFWRALVALGIDVWLGRVGSKLNIADIPTRDKPRLPFKVLQRSQYKELFTLLDIVRRARDNVFREGDFSIQRKNSQSNVTKKWQ